MWRQDYKRGVFGNNQSEIGNYIIKDRCLELYNDGNRYHFSICKNTVQGNYYVKIYDKPRNNYFMLKEEEAYDEISSLKSNLEGIDGIETFLDLNLLNSCVLDELKEKVTGKSK